MPHKHKRRQNDPKFYDLPPSLIAKPLPVRDPDAKKHPPGKGKGKGKDNAKGKAKDQDTKKPSNPAAKFETRRKAGDDDTPKAFLRLMQRQQQQQANKKRKRPESTDEDSPAPESKSKSASRKKKSTENNTEDKNNSPDPSPAAKESAPHILPGEKLSDFAARVDREMPLSEMKRSSKPDPAQLPKIRDHRLTKHEKHLRRLQEHWRKEEAEIQDREAAAREEREEAMEDHVHLWNQWEEEAGTRKAKKNNQKKNKKQQQQQHSVGGGESGGGDPWAKLNKKDRSNRQTNLFDVAEAPPQLTKPKEKFKVRGGAKVDVANVPTAAGSLRRREELAGERRNIVEEYRRLMAEKRA